jgi:hypothetical protein
MAYPGTPRKLGDTGEAVREIQRALSVQETGVFGETTLEHVTRFQLARGLEPDGIVGEKTWNALFFAPTPLDLGEMTLQLALTQVGTKEAPLGSNRGAKIDEWNRRAGAPLGSPWCASFAVCQVDDAAKQARRANPVPMTPSSSALARWARNHDRLVVKPEAGDIFVVRGGSTGYYHTGIVRKVLGNGRFSSVEGNSNGGGSPNGVAVVYRPLGRPIESCHFLRL